MRQKKQPHLPGFKFLGIREFGGSLIKGNPREKRPISTKNAMHVVMRSRLAKGPLSFLSGGRAKLIEKLVFRLAKASGIRIYQFANSGNHLHFLLLPPSRKAFQAFLRAASGLIARLTLGVERGRAKGIQFWDARPYTRIISWGREFKTVSRYVLLNTLEAIGFPALVTIARRGPTRGLSP